MESTAVETVQAIQTIQPMSSPIGFIGGLASTEPLIPSPSCNNSQNEEGPQLDLT
jgi:hypothetical protein